MDRTRMRGGDGTFHISSVLGEHFRNFVSKIEESELDSFKCKYSKSKPAGAEDNDIHPEFFQTLAAATAAFREIERPINRKIKDIDKIETGILPALEFFLRDENGDNTVLSNTEFFNDVENRTVKILNSGFALLTTESYAFTPVRGALNKKSSNIANLLLLLNLNIAILDISGNISGNDVVKHLNDFNCLSFVDKMLACANELDSKLKIGVNKIIKALNSVLVQVADVMITEMKKWKYDDSEAVAINAAVTAAINNAANANAFKNNGGGGHDCKVTKIPKIFIGPEGIVKTAVSGAGYLDHDINDLGTKIILLKDIKGIEAPAKVFFDDADRTAKYTLYNNTNVLKIEATDDFNKCLMNRTGGGGGGSRHPDTNYTVAAIGAMYMTIGVGQHLYNTYGVGHMVVAPGATYGAAGQAVAMYNLIQAAHPGGGGAISCGNKVFYTKTLDGGKYKTMGGIVGGSANPAYKAFNLVKDFVNHGAFQLRPNSKIIVGKTIEMMYSVAALSTIPILAYENSHDMVVLSGAAGNCASPVVNDLITYFRKAVDDYGILKFRLEKIENEFRMAGVGKMLHKKYKKIFVSAFIGSGASDSATKSETARKGDLTQWASFYKDHIVPNIEFYDKFFNLVNLKNPASTPKLDAAAVLDKADYKKYRLNVKKVKDVTKLVFGQRGGSDYDIVLFSIIPGVRLDGSVGKIFINMTKSLNKKDLELISSNPAEALKMLVRKIYGDANTNTTYKLTINGVVIEIDLANAAQFIQDYGGINKDWDEYFRDLLKKRSKGTKFSSGSPWWRQFEYQLHEHELRSMTDWTLEDGTFLRRDSNGQVVDTHVQDTCAFTNLASQECIQFLDRCPFSADPWPTHCKKLFDLPALDFNVPPGQIAKKVIKMNPRIALDILAKFNFEDEEAILDKKTRLHGYRVQSVGSWLESLDNSEFLAHFGQDASDLVNLLKDGSNTKAHNFLNYLNVLVDWVNANPQVLNKEISNQDVKITYPYPPEDKTYRSYSYLHPYTSSKRKLKDLIHGLDRTRNSLLNDVAGANSQHMISAVLSSPYNISSPFNRQAYTFSVPLRGGNMYGGISGLDDELDKLDDAIGYEILNEYYESILQSMKASGEGKNFRLTDNSANQIKRKLEKFKKEELELRKSLNNLIARSKLYKASHGRIDPFTVDDSELPELLQKHSNLVSLSQSYNKKAVNLIDLLQTVAKAVTSKMGNDDTSSRKLSRYSTQYKPTPPKTPGPPQSGGPTPPKPNPPVVIKDDSANPYYRLSNHYNSRFTLKGNNFNNVVQYYDYEKVSDPAIKPNILTAPDAAAVIGLSTNATVVPNWDNLREDFMKKALESKFTHDEELADFLLSTGDKRIIYRSNNRLWGMNEAGKGDNRLGELLEGVRSDLHSDVLSTDKPVTA